MTALIKDYPNEDNVESVETEQLIVSRFELPSNGKCFSRTLFVAQLKQDQPEVIAHATYSAAFNYMDWLEVNERNRRQGYATEFRRAIVHMIGCQPNTYAATEAGTAFIDSLGIYGPDGKPIERRSLDDGIRFKA
ncbi:hypothetical protein MalM25_33120 [Planctomycetes bacterium MalM25]|nr:hypothetical protein MalM25_33120 [Planctomycetes bacterium MalM25]